MLCVGLSTVDHIWNVAEFPPSRSRTHADSHAVSGGGPAATAAVAAARLGGRVRLWSNIGTDSDGDIAMSELSGYGVDVSMVRRAPGSRTAVSAVLVDPSGERHIFPFFGDALRDAAAEDFGPSLVGTADAVLVDMRLPDLTREVLRLARAAGVPSVADVSNARGMTNTDLVDHVIASRECAAEVLGRDDPAAALAALRRRPDQVVAVTLGHEGVLLDSGSGGELIPAFAVNVADTTGAGDVFHGAYAFGVASGWDPRRSAEVAAATAALSCTGVGRGAIPDAAAVAALLGR